MTKLSAYLLPLSFLLAVGCAGNPELRSPADDASTAINAAVNSSPPLAAWVEWGPGGIALARAVMNGNGCPILTTDVGNKIMTVHAAPDAASSAIGTAYPVTVCEVPFPDGATQAHIGDREVPVPKKEINRIVVIGDTGCVVKQNNKGKIQVQDCNDPTVHWPFARNAAAAASLQPDLVVHVGDYHYREDGCPEGNTSCEGSPGGDIWNSWYADFFKPAGPLLKSTPWIFVRGNHEACSHSGAGNGFFRLLDPRSLPSTCLKDTAPYLVTLANHTFVIFDSSNADVTRDALAPVTALQTQIGSSGAWLLSHRPLWAPVTTSGTVSDDDDNDDGNTEPPAVISGGVGVPPGITAVFAGHRHIFRVSDFADHRPAQVIAGNGGTMLEKHPEMIKTGTPVDGTTVSSAITVDAFGFLVLDRQKHGSWKLSAYDQTGTPKLVCQMTPLSRKGTLSVACPGMQ